MRRLFLLCILGLSLVACEDKQRRDYDMPRSKRIGLEKEVELALELLSDAIKDNPSNPDNYYKRSILHLENENLKEALIDINRAERLSPSFGLVLFQKAKVLAKFKDKEALKSALDAEGQGIQLPDLYALIAEQYLMNNDINQYRKYIQRAEQVYPYEALIYKVKGDYLAKMGDTMTAFNHYRKAIEYRSNNFDFYDVLIKLYGKARFVDSALVYNEKAIRRFPDKRLGLVYNKGLILESVGLSDSAIRVYRSFLKQNPKRYDVLERIGNIYYRKKHFRSALVIYNQWAKAEPDKVMPFYKLALGYESVRNYAEAKKSIEKALVVEPHKALFINKLAYYQQKIEYLQNRYYPEEVDDGHKIRKNRSIETEQPSEDRRVFDSDIGPIEKIQKRAIRTDSL